MTLVNDLSKVFPGYGQPQISPGQPGLINNTALTSGQGTITVPATGSFSPTISCGKFRIKVYAGIGTAPTLTDILVTGTDGTTTVLLWGFHPNTAYALSTTAIADFVKEFQTDLNLTSFAIKITLAGTSPGATADVEILGNI